MKKEILGDIFGGLSAMLVAFPSAVAFGLVVFSPMGQRYAAFGAQSGIIGTIALGLLAALIGGAPRLISAPCAPAAAVLAAFVLEAFQKEQSPNEILLFVSIIAILSALFQLMIGSLGGGKLIKFIPYSVVAGYLSSVGLIIFSSQLPKFLGTPHSAKFWESLSSPQSWSIPSITVGFASMSAMILSGRVTRAIPAPIFSLLAGLLAYYVTSQFYPEMQTLLQNPLVVGPIDPVSLGSIFGGLQERFLTASTLPISSLQIVMVPSITLAVLLSIDTLKTCVVVDALTRSKHNSNRELLAQGAGNLVSALLGGLAGAGTMGPTLVNISSGGVSRRSGLLMALFTLMTLWIAGALVAWVPVPALAGILIVIAYRMIDKRSLAFIKEPSTRLDFYVTASVILTALVWNLIAAAGVGFTLSLFLFLRDQIRGQVVRRKSHLFRSKKRRVASELDLLERERSQAMVFELQGNLFFGTADQLMSELAPYVGKVKYILLDLKRVRSVDLTATHRLDQIRLDLESTGGQLLLSQIPRGLEKERDTANYFRQVGFVTDESNIKVFATLDQALIWIEDRLLKDQTQGKNQTTVQLHEFEPFKQLSDDSIGIISNIGTVQKLHSGDRVFASGDVGDQIYFIQHGSIQITLPLTGGEPHLIGTFGQGDFFGDMAFLDQGSRSADAFATEETQLFVLSRKAFDQFTVEHPRAASRFYASLSQTLAARLRHSDVEISTLQEA